MTSPILHDEKVERQAILDELNRLGNWAVETHDKEFCRILAAYIVKRLDELEVK